MLSAPETLIFIAFSFGAAIFHALLGVERSVWPIAYSNSKTVNEGDLRSVFVVLQGLSSYLPPSYGVVSLVGLCGLIWQCIILNWTWQADTVLGFWFLGQVYILTFGKIVQAVKDLRQTKKDDAIMVVRRVVRQLIRQHFNGLLHAMGIVVLEIVLITVSR